MAPAAFRNSGASSSPKASVVRCLLDVNGRVVRPLWILAGIFAIASGTEIDSLLRPHQDTADETQRSFAGTHAANTVLPDELSDASLIALVAGENSRQAADATKEKEQAHA